MEALKSENDSLKNILSELNNKYIFDSISLHNVYNKKNTYDLNSNFEMELMVIGYSPNKSYFVAYDSIVNGRKINLDTLIQEKGRFKYNTTLNKKKITIRMDYNIQNEFGQNEMGWLIDKVKIKN
ncbi:MAG: hypothetical protein HRT69_11850 [Flavobacteriaceae bacterium]|nr:hypothetical protein [Flavobacteriaceae bacterium]